MLMQRLTSLFAALVLLAVFLFPLSVSQHAWADPYGQGAYGDQAYNCNSGPCDSSDGGSLAGTGTDVIFIAAGAVMLSGLAIASFVSKKRKKRL
jgi:LPXTG-motif cell wall-anchored protein